MTTDQPEPDRHAEAEDMELLEEHEHHPERFASYPFPNQSTTILKDRGS